MEIIDSDTATFSQGGILWYSFGVDFHLVSVPVGQHRVGLHTQVITPATLSITIEVYQHTDYVVGMGIHPCDIHCEINTILFHHVQRHLL